MRIPVPRDELLTNEQKLMLKLGQRDEKMERKLDQPLLTQLMMNKNGQDEDELGTSGYYNFDKGYIKPETLAMGRNKERDQPATRAAPSEQQ